MTSSLIASDRVSRPSTETVALRVSVARRIHRPKPFRKIKSLGIQISKVDGGLCCPLSRIVRRLELLASRKLRACCALITSPQVVSAGEVVKLVPAELPFGMPIANLGTRILDTPEIRFRQCQLRHDCEGAETRGRDSQTSRSTRGRNCHASNNNTTGCADSRRSCLHKSCRDLRRATVVASSPTTGLHPNTGQPTRQSQSDHLCRPCRPR